MQTTGFGKTFGPLAVSLDNEMRWVAEQSTTISRGEFSKPRVSKSRYVSVGSWIGVDVAADLQVVFPVSLHVDGQQPSLELRRSDLYPEVTEQAGQRIDAFVGRVTLELVTRMQAELARVTGGAG